MAAQASPVQSWRIVVLRADFPLEDPDEVTTSGTGQFDLRDLSQALADYRFPYETPPHDRSYFERHMDALARYYRVVSEGLVEIDYAVFPQQKDAYRLPLPALIYGNGRSPEEIGAKWVQLVRDAVALAESDIAGPDFADFNSLIVIHAGLGRETGQFNDITSVYLSPDDVSLYGGGDAFAGSGSGAIRDACILPEAINVQGRAGLNGLIAKFFGHQLGLPGLSNFANGLPAVGGWSLMDIGANRFGFLLQSGELEPLVGFVPPHPIAWSKAQLGWVEPLVIRRDTTIALVATDRPSADLPKAVRIPISESEYFLLENRQLRGTLGAPAGVEPPFGSGEEAVWIGPDQVQFSDTLDIELEGAGARSQGSGVWLGVGEYDAFIPGSGILIWHVDDRVINSEIRAGAINNDRVHQGIALEEADGERDIGNLFFERQSLTEGTAADPFFVGPVPGGEGVGNTLFGPHTLPGSESNTGVATGIEVEILSQPRDTMWVQIRLRRVGAGWPLTFQSEGTRLQAVDLNGDGSQELLVEAGGGVWSVDADQESSPLATLEGGSRFLAAVPSGGGRLFTWGASAVTARMPAGDGGEELWSVSADKAPRVSLYSDETGLYPGKGVLFLGEETGLRVLDGATGQVLRQAASDPILGLTAVDLDGDGDVEIVAAVAQGGWFLEEVGTSVLWSGIESGVLAPVSGDLDGDGRGEVVVADLQGGIRVIGREGVLLRVALPISAAVDMEMSPALGDVDGDGLPEIVWATQTAVHVYTRSGLIPSGFPAAPPRFQEPGRLRASPVLADLDGDGRQEIFQATSAAGLYGFDDDGSLLTGFPLLTDGPVALSPVAGNLLGGGGDGIQLAALAGPLLYVWDPVKTLNDDFVGGPVAWGQAGSSAAGAHAVAVTAGSEGPPPDAALLPADRAYCYPNPVGAPGDVHLRFFLSRVASLELEVFDALGERAERIEVGAEGVQAAAEYEIVWSTSGYASGLYLCRLKATGEDGSKSEVVVRLAVSR